MRLWLVIRIVRVVSACWYLSYGAYEEYGRNSKRSRFWAWYGIKLETVLFPIARKFDYTGENWMGAEMAEHPWWG